MQHINIKIFAEATTLDLSSAIPVFHRWIQNRVTADMLIDVADYAHVPGGPGVMLIGHEATYSLDETRNRLGLLYCRKAPRTGGDVENLQDAFAKAEAACRRLEQEPEFAGKLRFASNEIELTFSDRLLYPNTDDTWQKLRPGVEQFSAAVLGPHRIERASDPRERFRVNLYKL